MIVTKPLSIMELITGQKVICTLQDSGNGYYTTNEQMAIVQNMNGGMSLIPYAAFGPVDNELLFRYEHVICVYPLADENFKAAHEKAWKEYRQKKTAIIV